MPPWRVVLAVSLAFPAAALSQQPAPQPPPDLVPVLTRVAEEAAVFEESIVKTLTQETLEQHSQAPARFKPRVGQKAVKPPQPVDRVRTIVSEYTVGTLKDSASHDLVEFRQVISVDGAAVQSSASARHALSLAVLSEDDRARKRMLEDFAGYGLVDIATDYGIILLAFSKRGMANMSFAEEPETKIDGMPVRSIAWMQTTATEGELEFRGKQAARIPLEGRILVRRSDFLPLRVEVWAEDDQNKTKIRDEATVVYVQSEHGFLMPASVVHRHLVNGTVTAENRYTYQPFRLFTAETDIKFGK